MEIVLLGAGAMGSYFGARLALAGHLLALVDPDEQRMAAIRSQGLTLREDGSEWHVGEMEAVCAAHEIRSADVVIVLTKAHHAVDAIEAASHLIARAAAVVILSNGLGCGMAAAQSVPADRLFHGASAAGAVLEGPNVVRHHVCGLTCFGAYLAESQSSIAQELCQVLNASGIESRVVNDPESWIWTKLMINVAYNAATAITGVRNGQLIRTPGGRGLVEAAVKEALAVAHAHGTRIEYKDPIKEVVDLGLGPIAANQSTMLQDVLRSRSTEVDFLNGAIVREGARLGVPTPVNETLARLVRVIEDQYAGLASAKS